MARLQLSKSSLAREQQALAGYQRFLPSLDLKRQQLMAERAKAMAALKEAEAKIDAFRREVGEKLPMLANTDIDLDGLATLRRVEIADENVVGVKLPRLERIELDVRPYSAMAKPHWVDAAARLLHDMLEMRIAARVGARRVTLLDAAVKTMTQRVNLFEKVLIPRAQNNIRRIRVYLSDEQMSATVRSKISKRLSAARLAERSTAARDEALAP